MRLAVTKTGMDNAEGTSTSDPTPSSSHSYGLRSVRKRVRERDLPISVQPPLTCPNCQFIFYRLTKRSGTSKGDVTKRTAITRRVNVRTGAKTGANRKLIKTGANVPASGKTGRTAIVPKKTGTARKIKKTVTWATTLVTKRTIPPNSVTNKTGTARIPPSKIITNKTGSARIPPSTILTNKTGPARIPRSKIAKNKTGTARILPPRTVKNKTVGAKRKLPKNSKRPGASKSSNATFIQVPYKVGNKMKKAYKCVPCGKIFQYKSLIERHMFVHNGSKPMKCPECPARFSRQDLVNRHLRTHSGRKPYRCIKCSRQFLFSWELTQHVHRHFGYKPFVCGTCKNRFTTLGELRQHQFVHTVERPFKCSRKGCTKNYKDPNSLTRHIKRTHIRSKD